MKKHYFIGVAGNIGVGKTTFTNILGKHFDWKEIYESVDDNPYLSKFYNDMQRWSFNLQIYFLYHRFSGQIEINSKKTGVIQDRTIYEDREIFAKNLYSLNHIDDRDWETYKSLFNNMVKFIDKPDLIIYLRASTDTLISRIKNRGREYENNISSSYLHSLNISYDKWINNCKDFPILIIEYDNFNIFKDKDQLDKILKNIEITLSK